MKKLCKEWWLSIAIVVSAVECFVMPSSCNPGQYYEPGTLTCETCPANVSMVTSADGYGCSCEENSIKIDAARCKPCNATEVVSSDGLACVPRKCQNSSSRIVCRKCPTDYITVTQHSDGSPLKEVICVKCSRGYKAQSNACVRCESCACARNQVVVRGICVPKAFVNKRPKYEESSLHPLALLEAVKHEYLCMNRDVRACRALADECVRNFYSPDVAGPCRLWTQPNITTPRGLPQLTVVSKSGDKSPGEINLSRGMDILLLAAAVYKANGGFKLLKDTTQQATTCRLPVMIRIGNDFSYDCTVNLSTFVDEWTNTVSPYLYEDGDLIQVPVFPWKVTGYMVQGGTWSSNKFTRYFIADNSLSTAENVNNTVYLRTALIRISIVRDKNIAGHLRVNVSMEVHYAMKPIHTDLVIMSLRVEHHMPDAGVLRGLEIWGGVLFGLLSLFAVVQWRGIVRRGGMHISLVPLLSASVADTLHFAAWFSTLQALAAEAGTLGITLPMSHGEERIVKAFIYSAVALKAIKVAWLNFKQCRCDIFFLDWTEYNPPFRDLSLMDKSNNWRASTLAREWITMQTKRRVSPGFTVTLVLLILQLMTPWQSYLPHSRAYKWAVATIAWWTSYAMLLLARWVSHRLVGSPIAVLPRICSGVGLSLLVFEEEYYAHYVHGRNDESKDLRSMAGPLATCRVVCASQLRAVYKQLSTSVQGLGEVETRQTLLSRFLATFFERALDGLSWVASERTIFERLLDVELTTREAGNTSTLLYDSDDSTPSCFSVTWWGEEWSLATFDAMLFSSVLIASDDTLLAALVTVLTWQVMKQVREWFSKRNQKDKTEIEIQ